MKQIRTTIESPYEPNDNSALWLDTSNPDAPILKAFTNGKWQATIGGEKVTEISGDSTDEEIPTAKAVNDRITALADEVGVDLSKYEEYFTIEATVDDTTIYFRQSPFAVQDGMDPLTVEVSTDDGATWTEITASPAEDDVPGATIVSLNTGEKVLIRGNNSAYGYYSEDLGDWHENCNFWSDHPCYVYGNIMSLISKEGFGSLLEVEECAFVYFFSDYSGELDWSWVLNKTGNELLLPATTLSNCCYYGMFSYCTALTTAPELPATALADSCYESMFYYCTSLTAAPSLTATTLADNCYSYMFRDCSNLSSSPVLPATTLVSVCYSQMFRGCSSLNKITCLATDKSAQDCTNQWARDVASSGTFIKSPDATWESGRDGIPEGWTVEDYEDTGNVPVTTAPMDLTESQKEQVRDNIGVVKPIKMIYLPVEGDGIEEIFSSGMTLSEIEAASRGERNGVVYQSGNEMIYMPILEARYGSANYWYIEFCSMDHTSAGELYGALGRYYRMEGGTLIITTIEI